MAQIPDKPRLPGYDEHVALAGMTGSGKTVAGLDMLSRRLDIPWVIIDHKREDYILDLPHDVLSVNSMVYPEKGIAVVKANMDRSYRTDLEALLLRLWNRKNIGIYVDEGHLVGTSPAVETVMVTGRSRTVPMVWTSQRATGISPFIWGQSSIYRCFRVQTTNDIKRFNENFNVKYQVPPEYHSYYFDVKKNKTYLLKPGSPIAEVKNRIEETLRTHYIRV